MTAYEIINGFDRLSNAIDRLTDAPAINDREEWEIRFGGDPEWDGFTICRKGDCVTICEHYPRAPFDRDEMKRFAALILAAPKMFAELHKIRTLYYESLKGDFAKQFIAGMDMVSLEAVLGL